MSAFFIVPARAKNSMMNLFADHPPLEKRLAALSRLEAQLQGTVAMAGVWTLAPAGLPTPES